MVEAIVEVVVVVAVVVAVVVVVVVVVGLHPIPQIPGQCSCVLVPSCNGREQATSRAAAVYPDNMHSQNDSSVSQTGGVVVVVVVVEVVAVVEVVVVVVVDVQYVCAHCSSWKQSRGQRLYILILAPARVGIGIPFRGKSIP